MTNHLLRSKVFPSVLTEALAFITNKTSMSVATLSNSKDFDLWYYRLGHPFHSRLDLLNINCSPKLVKETCSIYPMAKMHKLPFLVSYHKYKKISDLALKLVMMDLNIYYP